MTKFLNLKISEEKSFKGAPRSPASMVPAESGMAGRELNKISSQGKLLCIL